MMTKLLQAALWLLVLLELAAIVQVLSLPNIEKGAGGRGGSFKDNPGPDAAQIMEL